MQQHMHRMGDCFEYPFLLDAGRTSKIFLIEITKSRTVEKQDNTLQKHK